MAAIPRELYEYIDKSGVYAGEEKNPLKERFREPASESQEPAYRHEDFSQETVQFRMGQHVQHKLYGRGKIVNLSGFGDDMRIIVLFNDGARRKMMAKFADLETS